MKLTVLGSCGPWPAPGGACSSYLVQAGETALLLDAGPGSLARLIAIMPPQKLSAIVLSHLHYDHFSDLLPMLYSLGAYGPLDRPLRILAPDDERLPVLLAGAPVELLPARDREIDGVGVRFHPARHPIAASMIALTHEGRTLVYSGDTNECEGLADFARGCDLLLCDAALPERAWSPEKPHLSALRAARLACQAEARALVLTHMHPLFDAQECLDEARTLYPRAKLAREGVAFDI